LPIVACSPILLPMNCAILFRINGGALRVVTDADGQPREFADRDDAFRYTEVTTLSESNIIDWQIVELERALAASPAGGWAPLSAPAQVSPWGALQTFRLAPKPDPQSNFCDSEIRCFYIRRCPSPAAVRQNLSLSIASRAHST
jgi:hypothetical protein